MALVSAAGRAHSALQISESRSRTRPVPRRSIAIDRSIERPNAGQRRFRKALRIRRQDNEAFYESARFRDRYVTDLRVKELSRVHFASISFMPQQQVELIVDNAQRASHSIGAVLISLHANEQTSRLTFISTRPWPAPYDSKRCD
jgi:hypothetical protein